MIHLFDLDHTLISVNSSFRFGLYLYQKKILPLTTLLYLHSHYLLHKIGLVSPSRLNQIACDRFFIGRTLEDTESHVGSFLDQNFEVLLYQPAVNKLADAIREGHYTVILSGSPQFLVGPFAERLGVDEWGATQYAIDGGGRISGIESYMDGDAKASYLSTLCKRLNIPKSESIGYSDSHLDLPFLQAVGEPVVVNPNKKLARFAKSNNWPVL